MVKPMGLLIGGFCLGGRRAGGCPGLAHRLRNLADRGAHLLAAGRNGVDQTARGFRFPAPDCLGRDVTGIFDDLERPAIEVEDRVVGRLNPDFAAAPGDALVLGGLELSAVEALPEFPISS
jgi:hypothetical protein